MAEQFAAILNRGVPTVFNVSLDGNLMAEGREEIARRTERHSHYFGARLADQFDAVIHYDHTRALHPLERTPEWESGEPPETFPSGL